MKSRTGIAIKTILSGNTYKNTCLGKRQVIKVFAKFKDRTALESNVGSCVRNSFGVGHVFPLSALSHVGLVFCVVCSEVASLPQCDIPKRHHSPIDKSSHPSTSDPSTSSL
jgi:hypothetical protein